MAEILTNAATVILTSLLSLLSAYIVMYMKKLKVKTEKEIEKIEDQQQKELFDRAIETVDKLATQTVTAFEQTCAGELRKLVKEGTIDREYLENIGKDAVVSVYCQLKPEFISALEKSINDVEGYIRNSVEDKVLAMKKVA